ncbi:hypothetical protein [Chitinophaga rhizosphaerae]|uniref:hypothetical protein n=1 Tax=Chitinophaga rhizosphaerae TaxID=1864947 RepID=UPI0013E0AD37|nr:hypothetical protein [Chitinophaga rhizosphaerae]
MPNKSKHTKPSRTNNNENKDSFSLFEEAMGKIANTPKKDVEKAINEDKAKKEKKK